MRNDFAVFILTHGRPDRQLTLRTLDRSGYTGPVYLIIDNEDSTAPEYFDKYGDKVIQFDKKDAAERLTIDDGDNFCNRRTTSHVRNAIPEIAKRLGYSWAIQLDDDYTAFEYRHTRTGYDTVIVRRTADEMLSCLIDYCESSKVKSIAMSQGGDHIGGGLSTDNRFGPATKRKAMNSFVINVNNPPHFVGRLNEDVNVYTQGSRRGDIYLTIMQAKLVQVTTQSSSGGMTDAYLAEGTYTKSFYSVLYCPSAVKVGVMGDTNATKPVFRIHHDIKWRNCAVQILDERHRKPRASKLE